MKYIFAIITLLILTSISFSQSRIGIERAIQLNSYTEHILSQSFGDYNSIAINYYGISDIVNYRIEFLYDSKKITDTYQNEYSFNHVQIGIGPSFSLFNNLNYESGIYISFVSKLSFSQSVSMVNNITEDNIYKQNIFVYNRLSYYQTIYERIGFKIAVSYLNSVLPFVKKPDIVHETGIVRLIFGAEYSL